MFVFCLFCTSCSHRREGSITNEDSTLLGDTGYRATSSNDIKASHADTAFSVVPGYTTELFAKRILDKDFFEQEEQSDDDYVLLLEYLCFDHNEQFTEEVGEAMCNMLQQSPQRYSRIVKAINHFPKQSRSRIRNEVLTLLIATYYMQQDSVEPKEIIAKKIYALFPFLPHNKETDAMISTLYDNYYSKNDD